ncbi:tail fiber assembly protein [Pseudomonas cerasi]
MFKAKLNQDLIATIPGNITVFNFHGDTREYLSSSVEYLAVGVGLPANSCTNAPLDIKDGFVICRKVDLSEWEYVADHRGETVYSTISGAAVMIDIPGDYPEHTTPLKPVTPYDQWDGERWVTDAAAERTAAIQAAEKQQAALISEANGITQAWQTQLRLDIITEADKASLTAWMKYVQAVQSVDTSKAPDIAWPQKDVSTRP